ncbi:hypothetical protein GGF32_003191 [Allomyces javanicus]|nr:hypothetical protein GGF32_003191 [Allomyces javanicus]
MKVSPATLFALVLAVLAALVPATLALPSPQRQPSPHMGSQYGQSREPVPE